MTSYIPSLTLPNVFFENAALAILFPISVGTAIGFGTRPAINESNTLKIRQPPGLPPPQVFGPAWTLLYGLMGYASYRAFVAASSSVNPRVREAGLHGCTLYSLQLVLNFAWMPLYFGLKRPILASVDILALTANVGYLAYVWGSQVDGVAAGLLAPYLGWLGFASYLCLGSGYLNNWDFTGKSYSGKSD